MCFCFNSATGFPVIDNEFPLICLLICSSRRFCQISNSAAGFSVLDVKSFLNLRADDLHVELAKLFSKTIFGAGRGDEQILSYRMSSVFHIHHPCNAVCWDRVMKDDCIRLRLVKCQFLLLSDWQSDPVYCVLMHFPFGLVRYNSWFSHVVILFSQTLVHRVHGCEECRLSSLSCNISSSNQT